MDLDDEELKATRRMNGSDKDVGSIEERVKNYIQTYNGLKRNKDIVKSIDKDYFFDLVDCLIKAYKELEEKNKIIKGNYYTLCADIQMVTTELGFPEDTIIADEMVSMIKENYIPVSLVEEKRTKLKEQYNKVVNEINNQGMIDQLIDFKEVSAKLEMCEELLEKRK